MFSSVRYFEIRVFECFFRVLRFCVFKVVFFLFLAVWVVAWLAEFSLEAHCLFDVS